MSSRYLRVAILALGVATMMAGNCDPKGPDFFDLIGGGGVPQTGTVTGTVTVDGSGQSGVTVRLRDGSTTLATTTTGANGSYTFSNASTGARTVEIDEPSGAECAQTSQNVTVSAGGTATANFACTTPEPETGTVTGTVTVNGTPESGVAVTLREGSTVIGTTTTGSNGTYTFPNVATGTKNVSIVNPQGATCPGPQDVTVPAGGSATANFACTGPSGTFTTSFTGLVTDHRGSTSVICWVLLTTPMQPSGTFQVATTGPGVLNPTVSGALNASGQAAVEVGINLFGTYNIMQTVTSGSNQASASTTHNVDPTEGICPVAQSSLHFKRGVVALLPDDVRPLGLRPVVFRYRERWGDPAEPQIGLIAEEVVEVYPEAVFLDGEGRPQAIDYGILTRAVVTELESRLAGEVRIAIARLAF